MINQYYTDPVAFDKKIYNKKFDVNDYKNYKSREYYSWINKSFENYSFPLDYSLQTFYSLEVLHSSLLSLVYSLSINFLLLRVISETSLPT